LSPKANIRISSRSAPPRLKTDSDADREASSPFLPMPRLGANFAPIVYAAPIQMLAYHTAVLIGKDPDRPRNLAKSVIRWSRIAAPAQQTVR
jgi:glutamine---fructose-6-phosphate transaminase (isomerizing)